MASNKALISQATELAAELGIEVVTEGLTNKELSTLVVDLRARKKQPSSGSGTYVAEGRAVTSKIGVLTEGHAVEAKHFVGGQKTLDNLIKLGHCVEAP